MRIVFDKIITDKETLNISLDGGVTSVEKPVNDLLKYGYSFDETECSDLDNIKLGNGEASTATKPTFEATLNTAFKSGELRYVQKASSEVKTYLNSLPENTIYNPYRIEIMDIPSNVTITPRRFNSTRYFKAKINKNVTSIGGFAFYGCSNLSSINIPDSVASIGKEAFYDCYRLTSITIPDSVTTIDYGAFAGCTSLSSINISDSVTSIGGYTFNSCSNLTSINYTGTEEQWNAITKGSNWNSGVPSNCVINYNYKSE